MKDTLGKDRLKLSRLRLSERKLVTSLDDIPEFDTPEAEASFWKTHRISQDLIDQVPADEDNDQ